MLQRDKENLRVHKVYAYGCSRWLDYLYLATLCPEGWLTSSSRKDMDYMRERLLECLPAAASSNKKRLMGDEERMSLPEMAEAAVVFQRMGKAEEAELLMTSLREHLVMMPKDCTSNIRLTLLRFGAEDSRPYDADGGFSRRGISGQSCYRRALPLAAGSEAFAGLGNFYG